MKNSVVLRWDHDGETVTDEAALVQAAQQDLRAFAPLYQHYRNRVYGYLRARSADPEEAADLTQHVFLLALSALPYYRIQATPFGVWLFRIARNAAIDRRRRQRVTVPWEDVPEEQIPCQNGDVENRVLQQEAYAHLQTVLAALDAETRDLLLLRFAARLTAVEIGAVIGKSPSATSKRLQRALQTVKEHYHDVEP